MGLIKLCYAVLIVKMNGKKENKEMNMGPSVHLLLAGHSLGHLIKVIQYYKPVHIDLFTSQDLFPSVREFIETYIQYTGSYNIQCIPAFTIDSLTTGVSIISKRYNSLKSLYPECKILFGITGGTNTMAIEMALSALLAGETMHYVIQNSDDKEDLGSIIHLDTDELQDLLRFSYNEEGKI